MKAMKLLVTLIFTFVVTQVAAEEGAIRLSNNAMKQTVVVNDKGEREIRFVEPTSVVPGDVILYTIEFENIGKEAASNIVIDDPVPNNSFYRDGSAKGDNTKILFSVDGENFDVAENLFVTKSGVKTLADNKDYRSLRWIYTVPLKPGEKKSVSFKTQIKKPGE